MPLIIIIGILAVCGAAGAAGADRHKHYTQRHGKYANRDDRQKQKRVPQNLKTMRQKIRQGGQNG